MPAGSLIEGHKRPIAEEQAGVELLSLHTFTGTTEKPVSDALPATIWNDADILQSTNVPEACGVLNRSFYYSYVADDLPLLIGREHAPGGEAAMPGARAAKLLRGVDKAAAQHLANRLIKIRSDFLLFNRPNSHLMLLSIAF